MVSSLNFDGNHTWLNFENDQESYSVISTPGVSFADTTPDQSNGCVQEMRIFFANVHEPEFVLADVGVLHEGRMKWAPIGSVDQVDHVPGSDRMEVKLTVTNLLVDIFPPPPEATIGIPPRFWLPTVSCTELDQQTIFLRYIHFGKEWESFRDSEFLDFDFIDSGDVENGIGFVGAIRRGEFSFNFAFN